MVCPSPTLGAQEQPSPSREQQQQPPAHPDLLWLAHLTGAHLGLPPIPQDPEDRCSIWENLVSLVDFQCPGFPLTSEELCEYIDFPRTASSSSSSSSSSGTTAVTLPLPQAVPWPAPPSEDIDYKTNPHVKPPYSYATLICMAMEASGKPKLTLAAICKWIRDNFCYFRRAHPSWQSSIRHNLCINKRFVKVPRDKGEPGRGAFWKLHPQYSEWLKSSGTSEGRREQIPAAFGRKAQPGAWSIPSPDWSVPSPAQSVPSSDRSISSPARSISSPARSIPSPARSIPSPARSIPSPARSPQGDLEVGAELQRLLQEFEEFENTHNWDPQEGQPRPTAQPEGSWLPCSGPGSPEEPGELTELTGSTDWEALLNPNPEQGDFCSLDPLQLLPCTQPGMSPQQLGWPQGQEQQILGEPSSTKPGSDETLTAAAFLEAAWNEGTAENLCGSFPADPLFQEDENIHASLPTMDAMDWDPQELLSLF